MDDMDDYSRLMEWLKKRAKTSSAMVSACINVNDYGGSTYYRAHQRAFQEVLREVRRMRVRYLADRAGAETE